MITAPVYRNLAAEEAALPRAERYPVRRRLFFWTCWWHCGLPMLPAAVRTIERGWWKKFEWRLCLGCGWTKCVAGDKELKRKYPHLKDSI